MLNFLIIGHALLSPLPVTQEAHYLREPIAAACLVEVANATDQKSDLLETPVLRDAARSKARKLSSLLGRMAGGLVELDTAYKKASDELKDEFENGIASKAEIDALEAKRPPDPVEEIASTLREYPNCFLLDRMYGNWVADAAKRRVGQ